MILADHWRHEWNTGVQVPVCPESMPGPEVIALPAESTVAGNEAAEGKSAQTFRLYVCLFLLFLFIYIIFYFLLILILFLIFYLYYFFLF